MRLRTQRMKWRRKAEGLNGEGPSQECSLPLILAPSWPPQPCPSSTGHTLFTATSLQSLLSGSSAPSLGLPSTNPDLSPSPVLIGHSRR